MTLPKETKAFICADCGVVSLAAGDICRVQGQGRKADWCGTSSLHPPAFCKRDVHEVRYVCGKCGQAAIHPELLCEPKEFRRP